MRLVYVGPDPEGVYIVLPGVLEQTVTFPHGDPVDVPDADLAARLLEQTDSFQVAERLTQKAAKPAATAKGGD